MKLRYPGPYPSVEIPAAGLVARRGETVEVPDDLAASLVRQGWEKVPARRRRNPSKPQKRQHPKVPLTEAPETPEAPNQED